MKKPFRILLGLALLPSLFCIYFLDRLYLFPLIWMNQLNIKLWFKQPEQVAQSFIRVFTISLINFILYLIF